MIDRTKVGTSRGWLVTSWLALAALTATAGCAVVDSASPRGPGAPEEKDFEISRPERLSIAREIINKAGFATLVTLDESGAPQARIMDPLPPSEDFVVWMATNPKSRKVDQIRADPRVVLTYFVPSDPSHVTLHGRARLVDDEAEKALRWKKEWQPHYPDRGQSLLLIEVRPTRLEIISVPRGLTGDPETWMPDRVDFPAVDGATEPPPESR